MTPYEVGKVFDWTAARALSLWETLLSAEDVVQELWVWYLGSPAIQATFAGLQPRQRYKYAMTGANQILSKRALAADTFNNRALYSGDSIREALEGTSTNPYLVDILPLALDALNERNPDQAEAIRSRYTDGVVPVEPGKSVLKRAIKSLTDELNVTYLTTTHNEGKGSRNSVFPDSVKRKGAHGDPTGEIAMTLLEQPELRGEYLDDDGWDEIPTGLGDDAADIPPNIFDGAFNGMGGSEMYRAAVMPDLFPEAKPMLTDNWPLDDKQMYCGGEYTVGYLRLVKGVA